MQNPLTAQAGAWRVLALDTCLNACQAAILEGGLALAAISEPMSRGHQERLALMVQGLMRDARLTFADIDLIGVTVGPGSFTGLRVGLAFAKGLALALARPCVGVGTLEALAAGDAGSQTSPRAAIIDAGRGRVFIQMFADGRALTEPDVMDLERAHARLIEVFPLASFTVVGPGANLLAAACPAASLDPRAVPDPAAVGRLAMAGPRVPARPLYLRAPDATPKAGMRAS